MKTKERLDSAQRTAIKLARRRAELWQAILDKADPKLRQELIEVDEAATAAEQRADEQRRVAKRERRFSKKGIPEGIRLRPKMTGKTHFVHG